MSIEMRAVHVGAKDLPFVDIGGGNKLKVNADAKVESIVDGLVTLEFHRAACEAEGLPRPKVLVE